MCWSLQMALLRSGADRWEGVIVEEERRKQLLIDEELRLAIEKSKPRSQKKRIIKPWVSACLSCAVSWHVRYHTYCNSWPGAD